MYLGNHERVVLRTIETCLLLAAGKTFVVRNWLNKNIPQHEQQLKKTNQKKYVFVAELEQSIVDVGA